MLAWGIIVLSPVAAAMIASATTYLAIFGFLPTVVAGFHPFFAVAASPLAALGPAAGALLLRGTVAFRVIAALVAGFIGHAIYWIIDTPVSWLFGFG